MNGRRTKLVLLCFGTVNRIHRISLECVKDVVAKNSKMKISHVATQVIVAATVAPGFVQAAEYVPVPLEAPLNWYAGRRLFPAKVMAGYNAAYEDYSKYTWAEHVLAQCKNFSTCGSCLSFSGTCLVSPFSL